MKVSELKDERQQVQLIDKLWAEGESMWSLVSKDFEKYRKVWQNLPAWLDEVPRKRSKARDPRLFRAMEKIISTLSARPSTPNVVNILESKEATQLSNDLQKTFLQKYQDIGLKNKVRRALRYLFLSRFFVFKVVWDKMLNDFDVRVLEVKNVRVHKKATTMYDAQWVIEKIPDIPALDLIAKFPNKRVEILRELGVRDDDKADINLMVENRDLEYYEIWKDGEVIYKFQNTILAIEPHPYWDWKGMLLTTQETLEVKKGNTNVMKRAMRKQEERAPKKDETGKEMPVSPDLHQYLFNYFDRPIAPYIFGTMFAVETRPVGETSLFDQVGPLQEEVDKRKRQISDNTEMMNGSYKIDTNYVKITKAEAQAAKSEPRGIWFGKGVSKGVDMMFGKELPATVFNEMSHSINEIDSIMGALQSLNPEQMKGITATAREIDRQESYSTLDELIEVVDNIHLQIYSWMYQMMKVKYTEMHYVKIAGADVAKRIIELTNSDMNEGIEIKIIPGQILPQNRVYRAEKALEEISKGIIDPLTYFEATERDNAAELAKRVEMYKISPFLVLPFTDEEMAKITPILQMMRTKIDTRTIINFKDVPEDAKAELLAKIGVQMGGSGGGQSDQNAQEIANFRAQAEKLVQSPEFQKLPPDVQQKKLKELQEQLSQLQQKHSGQTVESNNQPQPTQ